MAYIQKYKDYNKYLAIKNKLDQYGIKDYTINSDYTIDVNGDAHFSGKSLKEEGKTIPQIAEATELSSPETTYYLMTLLKFGDVEVEGIDDMDEYYIYKLKK